MQNPCYEVVAVVLPEEAAGHGSAVPHTVLVRIYETDYLAELEKVIQYFMRVERPHSYYRTIPVGSSEDFVEYWIEFPHDATQLADRLRDRLCTAYTRSTRARRASAPDSTRHRPGGLAA